MRRECWRGGSCLFLGLYPPSEHYPCLLLSVLHEYAKYDTFLLQDLQLFTTGFVDKNSTASLFPLQTQDWEMIAAAKELRLLLEEKNSLVCMGVTGRTWVMG